MSQNNLSDFSMFELFRQEAENQTAILTQGLLALENNPTAAAQLEALMRAAHSLKGAARIVGLDAAVRLAHAMEDCFVAAQKKKVVLGSNATDLLLHGVDLLATIAHTPEHGLAVWNNEKAGHVDDMVTVLRTIIEEELAESSKPAPPATAAEAKPEPDARLATHDRVLRVTAENLNRLLGLAGESLVESRWLNPYADALLRLKRQQWRLSKSLEELRETLTARHVDERTHARLNEAQQQAAACMQALADRHTEMQLFVRRSAHLSHRLYREALASRMRPFADGVQGFQRLVRDLARSLGKEVKLEILGDTTPVDRDVLEKLEAPLTHLLRNAVDHGIEKPDARQAVGKPRAGLVRLEARHSAGLLVILVQDDGRGIEIEAVRQAIVDRKLTTAEVAARMGEEELLAFLFLPGFSMRDNVTEVSGRGVGLDVVQNMVKTLRGHVRLSSEPGRSTRFQLQLPLTLSVLRALLAEVAGEPYAFPLGRIHGARSVSRSEIEMLEGREHILHEGQRIGLVAANQILGGSAAAAGDELAVLVIGGHGKRFGVVVDKFLGERELVVQPLDSRLGKVKDISAAALMPDGAPVLIVDVEDMTRSIELLVSGGRLGKVQKTEAGGAARRRKRVLVIDDSLTVRELERKLLDTRGYEVEVAVDGMDGWNAVRTQPYDLIVSDVDMPRMDGIELVTLIKKDPRLKSLPVMIVSYKDREEDRQRGLDAGADYYLTKGSFHDETLLAAVAELIGEAEEKPAEG
ncbi:MAG: hybrid sensor histidine kinase/response regulator [Verrucomicrobia bacterium]|nr:hybrid sensor histidine kinase/response regulator [Verrucomicrobiota bacterium]